jgi:hypothetical protein
MAETTKATEVMIGVIGFFLLAGPFYAYYKLIVATHANLYRKTLRISVLAARSALFLPVYSTIMWLSLVAPSLYLPLQIPISIAEGYCFFSFFAMITSNLGGSTSVVNILNNLFDNGKRPLFPCCCPETGVAFYKRVYNALWNFIVTRTFFISITVILQMFIHFDDSLSQHKLTNLKIFAILFTLVGL